MSELFSLQNAKGFTVKSPESHLDRCHGPLYSIILTLVWSRGVGVGVIRKWRDDRMGHKSKPEKKSLGPPTIPPKNPWTKHEPPENSMLNFRALKVSTRHKWYNTKNKNIRNWMFVWINVPVSHTLNTKTYQRILRSVTFWGLRCLLNGLQDPEKLSLSPEKRCLFNRGNKYKDYVNFFPEPNLVSPE